MNLLSHTWKSSVRSILWGRELAANIFIGAILALLALNLLGLGLFIRPLLQDLYPGEDPIRLVNGIVLAWFFCDLILRIVLQKPPSMEVLPYLLLPIPKRRIVRSALLRMLFSGFNVLPLFAIVPIALTLLLPRTGGAATAGWVAAILGMMVVSNVLVFVVEKVQARKILTIPFLGLFLATLFLLARLDILDAAPISSTMFAAILESPWLSLVWLLVVAAVVEGATAGLRSKLQLESLLESRRPADGKRDGAVLARLVGKGATASYLALELRLLLRNTRPKASFGVAVLVVFFVPLYYVAMAPVFFDFYPRPDRLPTDEMFTEASLPEERTVRFVVRSPDVPEDAWVYVTGNQNVFGPWKPDRVPLVRVNDSTWSRTVPFMTGTTVRCIFTMGNWRTETFRGPEKEPDVKEFIVTADTTLVQENPSWKTPALDGFETFMMLYMAFLLVGMPMLVYGQFLFVWESNYFDLLLTTPVQTTDYLRAKQYLLIALGLVGLFIALPSYFIADVLLPIHIVAGMYVIGVNSFVLIGWSTFSRKRVDLSASIFSTQGKAGTNYMTILPTMIAPIVLFILANLAFGPSAGLYLLGALGLAGLLLMRPILKTAERLFHRKKYLMREGFRQS